MRWAWPILLLFAGCIVEPAPHGTLFACEDGDVTRVKSIKGQWSSYMPERGGQLSWPVTTATCDDGIVRIEFRPAPQEPASLELFLVHDPPHQTLNHDPDLDDPNSFRLRLDRFEVDGRSREPYRLQSVAQLKSYTTDWIDLRVTVYASLDCERCSQMQLRFHPSHNP